MKITNTLKEKSKKICSLSAYVIAATLIASPLAFAAAPFQANQGTVNTKFRSTSDSANGCSSNSTSTSCFYASAYDDYFTGEPVGNITVSSYSSDSYSYIFCSGSAYASVVSVNQGNGKTSVKATLNPSDPSCYAYNWNAGTVTVNLSGSYTDGGYHSSGSGKSTSYYNGTTYRYNSQFDSFDETFTGSITGFNGPWTGSASASRYTNREQVK
jgi:hypothetical protein